MSLKDYAHWNEDAEYVWWQEEGRFSDDYFRDDAYDDYDHDQWYEEEDEECDGERHPDSLSSVDKVLQLGTVEVWRTTCEGCGALLKESIEHVVERTSAPYAPRGTDPEAALWAEWWDPDMVDEAPDGADPIHREVVAWGKRWPIEVLQR